MPMERLSDRDTEGLRFKPIDEIPQHRPRRGPRDSECLKAYMATKEAQRQKLEVRGEAERVDKFYKSMVQWRTRHKEEMPINVRKDGDVVYLWIENARRRTKSSGGGEPLAD